MPVQTTLQRSASVKAEGFCRTTHCASDGEAVEPQLVPVHRPEGERPRRYCSTPWCCLDVDSLPNGDCGENQLPLAAGEQVTLGAHATRQPVATDAATAVAWTRRKLIFAHPASPDNTHSLFSTLLMMCTLGFFHN